MKNKIEIFWEDLKMISFCILVLSIFLVVSLAIEIVLTGYLGIIIARIINKRKIKYVT
jgi:VIT1/CCC1 family predicted Fe2+/Mn2+ transporter